MLLLSATDLPKSMTISLRHNVVSHRAANQLSHASQTLSHTMARVSSGNRLQRVGDDSAGSAVGINLSTRVTSGSQAIRNANDGISLLSISSAALDETSNILSRMREITVQAASETLADTERTYIVTEYKNLSKEMQRIGDSAKFNDLNVGDGSTYEVQVGVDGSKFDRIDLTSADINDIHTHVSALNLSSGAMAQLSIRRIDIAQDAANKQQATLGAKHNRLLNAINNQQSSVLSHQASASRINDADMAQETSQMTALQVKHSAGVAALGQARGMSQAVLSLI